MLHHNGYNSKISIFTVRKIWKFKNIKVSVMRIKYNLKFGFFFRNLVSTIKRWKITKVGRSLQKRSFCCSRRRRLIFLHKRLFRKLERTNQTPHQRTSQQTMNNYCHWKGPRPVGRTQKTPFPLSSDSRSSVSSDFRTNPNSCASKSRWLSTASSFRKSSQLGTSRISRWNHNLTACIKI